MKTASSQLPRSKILRQFAWGILRAIGRVPITRSIAETAYRYYFDNARGKYLRIFSGIYPNFDAARKTMRKTRLAGYDNEPSAHRLMVEWLNIDPSDYPVMFWLDRVLPESRLVFDWGGNVGLKYFAYRKYLALAPEIEWLVCDVPAVVHLGRTIAESEGADGLRFTTELDEMPAADVLLAAASLHFIDDPLGMLANAPSLPKHLILSKVPTYDMPSAVTVHNMGTSLCPYHLFNRSIFLAEIEALGYNLIDDWKSPNFSCEIPFHPEYAIPAYSGFYFRKRSH